MSLSQAPVPNYAWSYRPRKETAFDSSPGYSTFIPAPNVLGEQQKMAQVFGALSDLGEALDSWRWPGPTLGVVNV